MNPNMILSKKNISSPITIHLPVSKSECNRSLILSFLSEGKLKVKTISDSEDTETLVRLLKTIEVGSPATLDCGMAGTTLRFLTAALSIHKGEFILTGNERMKQRPIGELVDALKSLGAEITYLEKKGFPPLKITGKSLNGGTVEMDPSVSSQFVSALMMIGPQLKNGLKLIFKNKPVSWPYVKMTAAFLKECGSEIHFHDNGIEIPAHSYSEQELFCESDWSAASYFYSHVAVSPSLKIFLPGLKKDSLQGDAQLIEIYQNFGVETKFLEDGIEISNNRSVSCDYFEYDFRDCPDLAQTLAFTCSALRISGKFTGLSTLKNKETDRIIALKNEMEKTGMKVNITDNSLEFSPHLELPRSVEIKTYEDHRMAMSASVLVFVLGKVTIENKEVVAKSFPQFWEECSALMNTK